MTETSTLPDTERPTDPEGGLRRLSPATPLLVNTVMAALACLLLTGASLWWNLAAVKEQTRVLAVREARANFNKDMSFRLWAASHGGVYVPVSEQTPPNPHLSHVPERDIVTPSGKKLTLMNPAYMLRQLMDFHSQLYGVKGHITSLKPLNPANAPDPWEKDALAAFERGEKEVMSFSEIDGKPYLRLMQPMITKSPCLKCHAVQGYKARDIRGGVGISIPMAPFEAIARDSVRTIILSHILFALSILGGISLLFLRGRVRLRDRHKNELVLLESEERFRNTFEQAAVGIAHLSPDRAWLRVNRKFCDILGYSREELLAKSIDELIHPEQLAVETEQTRRLLAGEIPHFTMETRYLHKDGEPVWLSLTSSLVRGQNGGGPRYLISVIEDITGRKKLEAQLRQSQKMEAIGTMAGGIAHDFNNILTPILGYTELLLIRSKEDPRNAADLQEILKATNRAKELVRQILTFSRQTEATRHPMEIQPVVKEAVKLLRAMIPSSIEFKVEIDAHCGSVIANPTEIHQIIMNLCANAFHAMREKGGTLTVRLSEHILSLDDVRSKIELPPGRYLRLEVSDTGVGIPPEIRERIFEPYFTSKGQGEGTGLGLSVVHGIVKNCGGAITVYSEPGRGTSFHVYFPSFNKPQEIRLHQTEESVPGGTERILVVDDEQQIVDLLSEVLTRLGYTVTGFTSSLDALAFCRQSPADFDLLLSDQAMPKMGGLELIREVLAIRPGLPIILSSGFSEVPSREEAQALGISDYLAKPATARELAQAIRRALDGKSGLNGLDKKEESGS